MIDVVAAVLEREGRILICQRKGGRHALKWEFPGGKVEPGEDGPAALIRELREELRIEAYIGEALHTETVHYEPGRPLRLHFYQVARFTGEPVNTEFADMRWELPSELLGYDFLEGDLAFVKKLAARGN